MNKKVKQYVMAVVSGLRTDTPRSTFLMRDGDDPFLNHDLELDARIRSGDYFVTLAMVLDSLSSDIADYSVRANIEDLVSDLIYLHDNYDIIKKDYT